MSALRELHETGTLGTSGAQLLYDTVRGIARFRNFPPPPGHQMWDQAAVTEVAHTFMADAQTRRRLTAIATTAGDHTAVERLLEAAVHNFLRDEARRTDRGALMRRLRDVLEDSDAFVQVTDHQPGAGRWALRSADDPAPWAGEINDLVAASWEVRGVSALLWKQAARRGPTASRESLERVLEAVLAEAGASVGLADLARVVEQRFGAVTADPLPLDVVDEPATVEDLAGNVEARDEADRIWNDLSHRDRLILAYHDKTVRDLSDLLQLRKSAAAEARRQLMAKLRELLGDAPDPDIAALELVDRARSWTANRTEDRGPTSELFRHPDSDG